MYPTLLTNGGPSKQSILNYYIPFFLNEIEPHNDWVKLTNKIIWDEFIQFLNIDEKTILKKYSTNPRIVIGIIIIKLVLSKTDDVVLDEIKNSPVYQYFLGFDGYNNRSILSTSQFANIRREIGESNLKNIQNLFFQKYPFHGKEITKLLEEKSAFGLFTEESISNSPVYKLFNRRSDKVDLTHAKSKRKSSNRFDLIINGVRKRLKKNHTRQTHFKNQTYIILSPIEFGDWDLYYNETNNILINQRCEILELNSLRISDLFELLIQSYPDPISTSSGSVLGFSKSTVDKLVNFIGNDLLSNSDTLAFLESTKLLIERCISSELSYCPNYFYSKKRKKLTYFFVEPEFDDVLKKPKQVTPHATSLDENIYTENLKNGIDTGESFRLLIISGKIEISNWMSRFIFDNQAEVKASIYRAIYKNSQTFDAEKGTSFWAYSNKQVAAYVKEERSNYNKSGQYLYGKECPYFDLRFNKSMKDEYDCPKTKEVCLPVKITNKTIFALEDKGKRPCKKYITRKELGKVFTIPDAGFSDFNSHFSDIKIFSDSDIVADDDGNEIFDEETEASEMKLWKLERAKSLTWLDKINPKEKYIIKKFINQLPNHHIPIIKDLIIPSIRLEGHFDTVLEKYNLKEKKLNSIIAESIEIFNDIRRFKETKI